MFTLAILIGIYSYIIFLFGISSILYKNNIIGITVLFVVIVLIYFRNNSFSFKKITKKRVRFDLSSLLLLLLSFQVFVNIIGTLGPELSFDALWYHLTLPKLYLQNHSIRHIPGGLLYYSEMPKLVEMLYVSALSFGNETGAKLIHFLFGLFVCLVIYLVAKKFYKSSIALLAVTIFYSNLVVGWESITAYVDLSRTFFEIVSLWGFLNWVRTKEKKWLLESAVIIGLTVSTKLLGIGSVLIFNTLIFFVGFVRKNNFFMIIKNNIIFTLLSLLTPFPWFVFSYVNTGNPLYPFFTGFYPVNFSINLFSPSVFLNETYLAFTRSTDPLNPVYIFLLPTILIFFRKFSFEEKLLGSYCFLALLVWYITPKTGGGRFLLPYLPALSIFSSISITFIKKKYLKNFAIFFVIMCSVVSIGYRSFANKKYTPVVFKTQTKEDFLTKNLNFSFGDFYDIDSFFKKNITENDKVLLYGFHNLYYVNFPFIDSSWIKKGDTFNYIAVQNGQLPYRFRYWKKIYDNKITLVTLYTLGGQMWFY